MGNAKPKEDLEEDLAFADELAPGSILMHGQYRIESFLNAGGFGITYSARDSLDRRIVIKECFPGAFCRRSTALVSARSRAHQQELASIVRLFLQEARSLAKLSHPNIVGVHQVFEENNTAYMALDFVEGFDLLDMIENDEMNLTPEEIESILRKILDAISFVHAQGVLHRDISPDNILLDGDKNPVLIDFGAAREQASKQSRVLSALRVVKDGYSPQEFYISGSEQGPYSDLYALGASFYHLISGELPPNAQMRLAAVASGEDDPYVAMAGRFPAYRKPLLQTIDTSLAILPKDRIPTATAWLDMLDSKTPVSRKKSQMIKPVAANSDTSPKSNKGLLLASVAVVIAGVVGIAVTQTDMLAPLPDQTAIVAPSDQSAVTAPAETAAPLTKTPDVRIAAMTQDPMWYMAPAELPATESLFAPIAGVNTPKPTAVALRPQEHDQPAFADTTTPPAPVLPGQPRKPGLTTQWNVVLPQEAAFEVSENKPRIFSVNGSPVATRAAFDAAVRRSVDTPPGNEVDVAVTVGLTAETAQEQTWSLPIAQETILPNGLEFTSTLYDGAWMTQVAAVPETVQTDLQVGDMLLGDILTGQFMTERTSLPALVEAAMTNDTGLQVAVTRGGNTLALVLPYAAVSTE